MDTLKVLEGKIATLLGMIKKLKKENEALVQENMELAGKLEKLETTVLKDTKKLDKERELTKNVVDDLIKSIDSLVDGKNG